MNGRRDRKARKLLVRVLLLSLVAALLQIIFSRPVLLASPPSPAPSAQDVSLTLDNVVLSVQTPFPLPSEFAVAEPGNAIQSADSSGLSPFRDLQIIAIPFGTRTPIEALPAAGPGGTSRYEAELKSYRQGEGGQSLPGPSAILFGQNVLGQANLVRLSLGAAKQPQPVLVVEWIVEAGKRLWIVRSADQVPDGAEGFRQAGVLLTSLDGLAITSTTLDQPSSITRQVLPPRPPSEGNGSAVRAGNTLPVPSWWNGDCDLINYKNAPENPDHIPAYNLARMIGARVGYRGLEACGPRPWADGAPDVLVRFFPGAWGEYEWECVELSMRFMYLAYGIPPYSANGKDVVPNCQYSDKCKQLLEYIADGTPNRPPQPDDVISFCATCQYGHTAVVTQSRIDGSGNGSIRIIEQNASSTGSISLQVANWSVKSSYGAAVGWLHAR